MRNCSWSGPGTTAAAAGSPVIVVACAGGCGIGSGDHPWREWKSWLLSGCQHEVAHQARIRESRVHDDCGHLRDRVNVHPSKGERTESSRQRGWRGQRVKWLCCIDSSTAATREPEVSKQFSAGRTARFGGGMALEQSSGEHARRLKEPLSRLAVRVFVNEAREEDLPEHGPPG